ncbi:NAD(P)/FAD-dependent oxidoreductase [Oceanisphaera arctica]|uniref:FAD-dependent oxidoreductase n=1 Tax=Oceanisphaera arctica TaxID=641510 RepID=A0A2P5TK28_9GAMM|nr:FAD-dependent oxidoreductase [Oceanisphaera arctica]PPL15435.1 FAD-dependent oxidoreductase [Oceanisphaera arctica]GHA22402.1 D-amino-acid dehydrogenase [Oceanisphaera arctica]
MKKEKTAQIAVIGAGVVGLCNALTLQRAGYGVTLFDAQLPGSQTSSGNASYLATELIDPLANPGTLKAALRLWLHPHGPVATPLAYFHKALPWLWKFVRCGSESRAAKSRHALHALNHRAIAAWQRLLTAEGLEHHLLASGYLQIWENPRALTAAEQHLRHLQEWNINARLIDHKEVAELEPALAGRVAHAIYYPDACQMDDPLLLCQSLYRAFIQLGGQFQQTAVTALSPDSQQVKLTTDNGHYQFDRAVLSTGAWSTRLLKPLGIDIPLEAERGYHITWQGEQPPLSRPIGSAERNVVMTPLANGLRTVGFSEWGGLEVPFKQKRTATLRHHSQALLPELKHTDWPQQEWMGFRPTLPDSLPVIDRHPVYPHLLLAFGHQHLGLTQAAISAELILSLVEERQPALDLLPYALSRFCSITGGETVKEPAK